MQQRLSIPQMKSPVVNNIRNVLQIQENNQPDREKQRLIMSKARQMQTVPSRA
jgi:hypothetical protein